MAYWTKTELGDAEATRDPYELWYRPDGDDSTEGDAIFRPGGWYPFLCVIEFGPVQKDDFVQEEVIQSLYSLTARTDDTEGLTGDGLTATLHDRLYAIRLFVESGFKTTEILVFQRSGVPRLDLIETLQTRARAMAGSLFPEARVSIIATGVRSDTVTPDAAVDRTLPQVFVESLLTPPDREALKDSRQDRPVIGVVIDHTIGFANRLFRNRSAERDVTRFEAVWLQGQGHLAGATVGLEIGAEAINQELDRLRNRPMYTEQDLYVALGATGAEGSPGRGINGVSDRTTHGTGVAHVAFGADPDSDPDSGTADDPMRDLPLLGVQLPSDSVAHTNGYLHDLYVKSALNWIWYCGFLYMLEHNSGWPRFFVNHSFGTFAGRPDGFHEISADFDRRIASGEIEAVTVAAGNSFQSATHARLSQADFNRTSEVALDLRVQPDNRTTTFVRFWAERGRETGRHAAFPLSFRLDLPDGSTVRLSPEENAQFAARHLYEFRRDGHLLARVYCQILGQHSFSTQDAPELRALTLVIPPTANGPGVATAVPDGAWRLRCNWSGQDDPHPVSIWVERGDSLPGFPVWGRQSRFAHPAYQRLDGFGDAVEADTEECPIKRFGTLAASSLGGSTIAVGSYRASDNAVSSFSSASSTLIATRDVDGAAYPLQPRYAAISQDSPARPNILVSGTYSHSVSAMMGTSLAAPQVLRGLVSAALIQTVPPGADPLALVGRGRRMGSDRPEAVYRFGKGRIARVFEYLPERFTRP